MMRLFILSGKGVGDPSVHCVKLMCEKHVKVFIGNGSQLLQQIHSMDIIVIPGGNPIVIAEQNLKSPGKRALRKFKGTYIGICAGAVLATEGKRGHLGLVPVKCQDDNRQLKVELENLEVNMVYFRNVHWPSSMYYEGGPILKPSRKKNNLHQVEVIANFGFNVPKQMQNQCAICKTKKAILFSVHPEFSDHGEKIFADVLKLIAQEKRNSCCNS